MDNKNQVPAPLLAPLDRVFTCNTSGQPGEYLGMLGEDGITINGEDVTLIFAFGPNKIYHINTTFWVDNQDHVVR